MKCFASEICILKDKYIYLPGDIHHDISIHDVMLPFAFCDSVFVIALMQTIIY